MSLGISVAVVGLADPQAVQVSVTGATVGDSYTVTGSSGDDTWPVRGGNPIVPASAAFVLIDVASPINAPVTYSVTDGTTTATAAPVTVPYDGNKVLTSLDGRFGVTIKRLLNNGAPRSRTFRQAAFDVPGRIGPVVRYDVPAGKAGQIVVLTDPDQTAVLDDLLDLGGFAILRTNGAIRDLPAVQFIMVTSDASQLAGADNARTWTLDYQAVSDPEPNAVVAAVTWDDFDTYYAAQTWTNFNTEWSGATWDALDRFDFSQ